MEYLKKFFYNPFSYSTIAGVLLILNQTQRWPVCGTKWATILCGLYLGLFSTAMFMMIATGGKDTKKPAAWECLIYYAFCFAMLQLGPKSDIGFSRSTWNVLYIQMAIFHFGHYLHLLYK